MLRKIGYSFLFFLFGATLRYLPVNNNLEMISLKIDEQFKQRKFFQHEIDENYLKTDKTL